MNYTQNYHLGLPIPAERYDVSIVNANNTVIDGQMKTNADAITNHKNDHNNPHAVTAAQVGLGNVDNTSDANKPVSTAQAQYVTQAVSAESTRAQGVESTLSGQISAEVTRATGVESTLSGQISAEATRATGVENDLAVMISTETTRAQGAESDIRDYIDEKVSSTYKASGSIFFADLPALTESRLGNVYNIKDDFTTTASFVEGAGKDYPAGTNVAIIEKDEESYEEATVEETDTPSEMGLYELDGSDYVLTTDTSPVEGKTYYELTITPSYFYDVLAGFIDTSDFITDTDYATAQAAGIVKPDGTTVTVDENGVISSSGDVSSDEVSEILNVLGSKNLNAMPYNYSYYKSGFYGAANVNGISVRTKESGAVTVSGTATADALIVLHSSVSDIFGLDIDNGDYILSGCPEGGSENTYKMYVDSLQNGAQTSYGSDTGEGLRFTLNGDDYSTNNVHLGLYIFIAEGTSFETTTWFYPMIRPSDIKDSDFVPYADTNKALTFNYGVSGQINAYLGSKNLFENKAVSQIVNGITYTVNDDGTVLANGTATGKSELLLGTFEVEPYTLYVFSGGYSRDACLSSAYVPLPYSGGGGYAIEADSPPSSVAYGQGMIRSHTDEKRTLYVEICIKDGTTVDNVLFKPMIRLESIKDDAYVPFAKTNRQLTEDVSAIDPMLNILGAKNVFPNNFSSQVSAGMTYTVDDDGIISMTGVPSESMSYEFGRATLPKGTYILTTGNPGDEQYSRVFIFAQIVGGSVIGISNGSAVQGSNVGEFTLSNTTNLRFGMAVARINDDTITRTVKPMCMLTSIVDDTYAPYAKTNRQLTKDVETLQQTTFSDMTGATSSSDGTHGLVPAPLIADRDKVLKGDGTWSGEIGDEISDIVNILGAKNLCPNTATTQTVTGITFTVNSDGSVTVNGTATANTYLRFNQSFVITKGTYIYSSDSEISPTNNYALGVEEYQNGSWVGISWGEGGTRVPEYTFANDTTIRAFIVILSGATISNKTFYPMIRPAHITDDTYVTYAKTNKELTDNIATLNTQQIQVVASSLLDRNLVSGGKGLPYLRVTLPYGNWFVRLNFRIDGINAWAAIGTETSLDYDITAYWNNQTQFVPSSAGPTKSFMFFVRNPNSYDLNFQIFIKQDSGSTKTLDTYTCYAMRM